VYIPALFGIFFLLRGGIFMTRPKARRIVWIAAIVFLSGCVSSSKYHALEADRAALQSQRDNLNQEVSALRQEKQKAETEIASLNEKLAQQQQQSAEIASQKDAEIQKLKGTYESLVQDLKGEIEKGEIKVTQIRDRLTVNLVEKILFDSGHAEVKPQGKEVLKKVGNILKNVQDKDIRIEGFTDNVPIGGALRQKFPTNWELSTQRATNVLRFLQDEGGVDGSKLVAVGYGEYHPIASNDSPEGRAQNRRIEIVLVPSDIQEVLKELK
jgi:chemotaxis protein MotB